LEQEEQLLNLLNREIRGLMDLVIQEVNKRHLLYHLLQVMLEVEVEEQELLVLMHSLKLQELQ
jgi:hypothetical protein